MSIELVKEVLHNSPDGLDGTARLLLVVLAEMAQDRDRREHGKLIPARTCWPSQSLLMQRAGITSVRGLKLVYERLAKHGLDPRIQIGIDKNGRAVYAWHGTATSFRVPVMGRGSNQVAFADVQGGTVIPPSQAEGGTVIPPSQAEGGTVVPRRENSGSANEELQFPPNHKEPEVTFPPTPQPDRTVSRPSAGRQDGKENLILQDLASRGLDVDESRAVLEHAKQDQTTTTSIRGRLKQPAYIAQCRQAVKDARAKTYHAGPKCADHPTETAANCPSCKGDVNCADREFRFIGMRQPRCSLCDDPLIGYSDGITICRTCTEAVSV